MKQLVVYFFLAYLISWTIWFPLYSPAFGITCLPISQFQHGIGGLGPMIAALITTYIFERRAGIKKLTVQLVKAKPFFFVLVALLSPFVLAFIAVLLNHFINKAPVDLSGLFGAKEFPSFSFMQFFIYNFLFFGFGEETGWRGFALPRLQTKLNPLMASIVLTLFWALWHWPLFLYRPGFMEMGIDGTLGWLFSLLTGSVLLTWLYNSSRSSILVCAIFHSAIDIAFLADFADKNIVNYLGMLITVWGMATIVIFKRNDLSKKKKS